MDKKRILVYTENYLPSIGGLENNTLLLCKTLKTLGHKVTLLTPQENAQINDLFQVIESKDPYKNLNIIKNHDLILVNGGISFKILIPSFILNKDYIVIYQMASLFNHIHRDNWWIKINNNLRKYLAKKAKFNVGVSQYSFNELSNIFGNEKSRLLINPANPVFKNDLPIIKRKEFSCLFAGRLIEGKGIRLLIDVIKELRVEGCDVILNIVGEGPEKEWINSQLNLGFIFLHPPTSPQELKKWYQISNLTIIPSTSHIEGSPLVMAESLLCGTPVLVSNQPAMVTAIENKNLYFNSGNKLDLKEKIRALLNPEIYSEVLIDINKLSVRYLYKSYIQNLEKIINV